DWSSDVCSSDLPARRRGTSVRFRGQPLGRRRPSGAHDGRRALGLFWQIVVFLIVAAALGFVIGWVLRASRFPGEHAPRHAGPDAALVDERDRLRTELQAAREAQAEAENALVELRQLAEPRAGRVHELEQIEARNRERIAKLEQEL